MTLTIRTNNVPRPVLNRWNLTQDELKDFDYLAEDEGTFFRFKDEVYDLGEFFRVVVPGAARGHPTDCDSPAFQGWTGYQSDSFFHGLLIRYSDDFGQVVVGEYFS